MGIVDAFIPVPHLVADLASLQAGIGLESCNVIGVGFSPPAGDVQPRDSLYDVLDGHQSGNRLSRQSHVLPDSEARFLLHRLDPQVLNALRHGVSSSS
jgi:hypothetical protein